METPKPQAGTWTLTAPDGRTWQAESPLHCCGAEQRERVPADVALARILEAATQTPDEVDAERYRWLRGGPAMTVIQDVSGAVLVQSHKARWEGFAEKLDAAIDTAMR